MPGRRSASVPESDNHAAKRRRRWAMQITLTRSDLEAMPSALRRALSRYLEGRIRSSVTRGGAPPTAEGKATPSPLARQHVAGLLRDISFHRLGRRFRALLDQLADDGSALPRRKLAAALPPAERGRLGRYYIASLNKLAAKAAGQPGVRFCLYDRGKGVYTVDPTTQKWLRELLPGIAHAGEHEEPLWE